MVGYLAVFWGNAGSNKLLGALIAIAAIWILTAINILGTITPSRRVVYAYWSHRWPVRSVR